MMFLHRRQIHAVVPLEDHQTHTVVPPEDYHTHAAVLQDTVVPFDDDQLQRGVQN